MRVPPENTEAKLTGAAGRPKYQRWPLEKKQQIVLESYEADTSVSVVARRHGVNANQVFEWRRMFKKNNRSQGLVPGFVPVGLVPPATEAWRGQSSAPITIELVNKICVRVGTDVDEEALCRILMAIGRLS